MSMDLRAMLDELATDNEPPTQLSADGAYTAGRRRTRVRAVGGGTLGAAAVAGLVVAVTTLVGPPGATPAPAASSDAAPIAAAVNGISWVSAADAEHLYASVVRCPGGRPSAGCPEQLLGSDDGGRTWTLRSATHVPTSAFFAGPSTLVGRDISVWGGTGVPVKNPAELIVSTDGGRNWQDMTDSTTPVASVPSGGFATCGPTAVEATERTYRVRCTVYAVDPAARRAAPLANQPPLATIDPLTTVRSLGGRTAGAALWLTGSQGAHVGNGLSVAVSRDGGRTWRTTAVDPGCSALSELWHSAGATAKVICPAHNDGVPHAFRTDDYGATWHEMTLPRQLPHVDANEEYDIRFTVDGGPLGLLFPADESGVRLWTLPDGSSSWVPVATTGLAPYAEAIENTPDGGYVAYSGTRDSFTFYRSSDLHTWTAVTVGAAR
jgi:photosystem II stability/assembly factor-like uncharacterized protein